MEVTSEKQTVPRLRFLEFTRAWEQHQLGEYYNFKNGVNAEKGMYGHGRKFINVLDIISDGPITSEKVIGSVSIPEAVFESYKVVYGDVLFQRSSETREEVGQSNVYLDKDTPATFGGFVIRGHPIKEIDPEYVNSLLKTAKVRKDMTARSGGSTRYNVGQGSLSQVTIHVAPTAQEQEKIAAFLGAVDKKIGELERKNEHLEAYKKGCMQKLFSRELRFKDDQGRNFPDWEEKELAEVARRVTSKNRGKRVTRVLTNSATQGVVDQGDYFDHDVANSENLEGYYIVKKDDFVYNPRISTNAPVGPMKRNDLGEGVMSPLYTVFRFKPDEYTEFWRQFFNSSAWFRYMKSVANYGARHDRMAISTKDFLEMPLPYPNAEEQRKIADFLSAIDKKIALVAQELDRARTFKIGLLQQMFV